PGPKIHNLGFHYGLGPRYLYAEAGGEPLFTDNETNMPVVYGTEKKWNRSQYTKDAFHAHIVRQERSAVNPFKKGTKACVHYKRMVPAGGSTVVRLRLTTEKLADPLSQVDATVRQRKQEADEFYTSVHPPKASADEKLVQRQSLASLLWSKQI